MAPETSQMIYQSITPARQPIVVFINYRPHPESLIVVALGIRYPKSIASDRSNSAKQPREFWRVCRKSFSFVLIRTLL
jgi:hypothetical protein